MAAIVTLATRAVFFCAVFGPNQSGSTGSTSWARPTFAPFIETEELIQLILSLNNISNQSGKSV
jgi:hypothetical protein